MGRSLSWAVLLMMVPSLALAADPKFEFGKHEEKKQVIWKASAQAGAVYSTGNARSFNASGGATILRDDGWNRLALDLNGTYINSSVLIGADGDGDGKLAANEIVREDREIARLWQIKARYDRFFTARNTGYLTAGVLGNEPAGKRLVASGQAGYARLILKDARHELITEIGYDLSYEVPVVDEARLLIHSLRLMAALTINLTADTNFGTSVEILMNVNPEEGTPKGRAAPFEDTRVTLKAAVTTKLWKNLSFRASWAGRYDHVPGFLPPLSKPYADGFKPAAERLDTLTELALVLTIL